jgi:geranylgeranyl pyrophosphate synthase
MRYSSLSGGKRIRPMLVYASGHALGLKAEKLKAIACSVELIHAYSLIHDDLPAMDDDELRRGRATCHIQFDEATAILAGDALQALAFQTLADELAGQPKVAIRLVSELARACGSSGMAGGQMLDLLASGKSPNINQLEHIHELKTGALIRTCVVAPGIVAGSTNTVLRTLDHFGYCVGLGFQIQDDILDVTGDPENLGKSINADAERNKPTFPALIGVDASRARAGELRDAALASLETLDGDVSILAWLADYMISRDR